MSELTQTVIVYSVEVYLIPTKFLPKFTHVEENVDDDTDNWWKHSFVLDKMLK